MNFQGVGAMQWLQNLMISFGPVLLFYILNKFFGYWAAVVSISMVGVAGLLLQNSIINWLVMQFSIRKHKILEGFRER
jgi:hypothetical protein